MDAFGVTRDLRADDAGRVGIALGPMHPADAFALKHLDIKGTGGGAIVGADRRAALNFQSFVHAAMMGETLLN